VKIDLSEIQADMEAAAAARARGEKWCSKCAKRATWGLGPCVYCRGLTKKGCVNALMEAQLEGRAAHASWRAERSRELLKQMEAEDDAQRGVDAKEGGRGGASGDVAGVDADAGGGSVGE